MIGHTVVAVHVIKTRKRSLVKIHLFRKNKPTSGQRNKSDPRTKYLVRSSRKTKRDGDM